MNRVYFLIPAVLCLQLWVCSIYTSDTVLSGFVYVSDAVPDAILEIRDFSTCNFVGDRIDGYEQPTDLLTVEATTVLRAVTLSDMRLGDFLQTHAKECNQCEYKYTCKGGCRTCAKQCGDLYGTDTQMCQYFKAGHYRYFEKFLNK